MGEGSILKQSFNSLNWIAAAILLTNCSAIVMLVSLLHYIAVQVSVGDHVSQFCAVKCASDQFRCFSSSMPGGQFAEIFSLGLPLLFFSFEFSNCNQHRDIYL